jgi:hypothetical protein
MSRWIVFDRATAEVVESKTGSPVERRNIEDAARPGSIVALAAAASGAAIAVVPADDGEHALVMRFTRPERPQAHVEVPVTHVAPGGFLGLADEVVLEDEPAQPKKWWQKILD